MNLFYLYFIFLMWSSSCYASLFTKEKSIPAGQVFPNNWIDVPLDHFNVLDNTTWKMRFFENSKFFIENHPIFIEVGGESTIDGAMITDGPVYNLAKLHRGMLIETEHRFYGKSLPFSTNFSTKNLYFLQIEQALEDLAYFIAHYKQSNAKFKNSVVVLHGCSYPGMLVTWMRLKYPHLVDIAYASSAPLGVGLDYHEYYEIVNDVYANVSINCIDTIRQGFSETAEFMKTSKGRRKVKHALKNWRCGDPTEMRSAEVLDLMIAVLNVQNDPVDYEKISCKILSANLQNTSAFERLIKLIVIKSNDTDECLPDPDDGGETERNKKAWYYQTCTEMGTFPTLSRKNFRHPFAIDLTVEESVYECLSEFGGIVTEEVLRNGIERVTRRYGGKKPTVTKVVTVQGAHDPWKDLALLEDYTPQSPVLIGKGSHCFDVFESDNDPEDVLEVRNKVKKYISEWLSQIKQQTMS